MFNGNISMKFYDMSHFVRSTGKKNCTKSTLCTALVNHDSWPDGNVEIYKKKHESQFCSKNITLTRKRQVMLFLVLTIAPSWTSSLPGPPPGRNLFLLFPSLDLVSDSKKAGNAVPGPNHSS